MAQCPGVGASLGESENELAAGILGVRPTLSIVHERKSKLAIILRIK